MYIRIVHIYSLYCCTTLGDSLMLLPLLSSQGPLLPSSSSFLELLNIPILSTTAWCLIIPQLREYIYIYIYYIYVIDGNTKGRC